MKAHRQPASGRRWMAFGPGTVMALVAALYLIGSGWLTPRRPPSSPAAGRTVYEADLQGRLRRVDAPSPVRTPGAPGARLWKPEVGLLLDRSRELSLTTSQRARLQALNAAWLQDRASLQQALRGSTRGVDSDLSGATPGRGAAVPLIQRDLQDYSALSREYDARRAGYWERGLASLTGEQRNKVRGYQDSSAGAGR